MATGMFDAAQKAFLDGAINLLADDIRVVMVDSDYVENFATHDFLDDVPVAGRVGTPQVLSGKTTTGGAFDANDVTFSAVSNPSNILGVLVYRNTGTESTSQLIYRADFASPVVPNGGDITISWSNGVNRIFRVAD